MEFKQGKKDKKIVTGKKQGRKEKESWWIKKTFSRELSS